MKLIFLIPFFLISLSSSAEVIKLAVINSEFDENVSDFFLITDDQNKIHSMRYVTTMPNGGIFEDVSLPAERVMQEGATIVVRNNREAVKLFVEDFSLITGGTIKLNYLYSGVTRTWYTKRLKLGLIDNQFKLFDLENNRTNKLFMRINWNRLLGAVGIRDIQTSFTSGVLSAHVR